MYELPLAADLPEEQADRYVHKGLNGEHCGADEHLMRFWLCFQVVGIANVVAGRHGSSKQESAEVSNDQVASNEHYDREAKVHYNSQKVDGPAAIDVAEAGQSKAADYDTKEEGRTEQTDVHL